MFFEQYNNFLLYKRKEWVAQFTISEGGTNRLK